MTVMKLLALCSMVSLSYSRQFLRIEKYHANALAGNLLKVGLDSEKLAPAKEIVKVLQQDTVIAQPVQKVEQATGDGNSTLLHAKLEEEEEAEMGEEEADGEEDEDDEEMKHQTEAEWLANETVSMTAAAYANQSFAWQIKSSDQVQKSKVDASIYSTCQTYETAMNDDGGGASIYLDRHRAVCKAGTAMTGWRLDRGGTHNKYKIVYQCCEHVLGDCKTLKTNLNDDGGHKRPSIYLDRHHPKCNSGQAMRGFRVDRGGTHDKIRINSVCCDLGPTKMGNCQTKKTPANDWGNGNTVYMDRHHPECGYRQIMTGWKLERPHREQIRIKYQCCEEPDYKVENS
jgi:hypothetical protein